MLEITIDYEASWRNSFLDGDNSQKILDEKGKVIHQRKFIGSMTALKNDENYIQREITQDTVMGVLNRLIGDQRRLFQSRTDDNYFFKEVESLQLVSFEDKTDAMVSNNEIVYLRNLSGSTDQNAFSGVVKSNDLAFCSEFSQQLWAVLFISVDELCDFILNEPITLPEVEIDPLLVEDQVSNKISKLKSLVLDKLDDKFSDKLLNAEKVLIEQFSGNYRNAKGDIIPTTLYCSALYLQLERLKNSGYDVQNMLSAQGNISGFSKRGFTKKDFMKKYTSGNGKLVFGNPYVRERMVKGQGKIQDTLTKVSGTLNIKLNIDEDAAKNLKQMIDNAGVNTFYLGKKGLAYVRRIDIY